MKWRVLLILCAIVFSFQCSHYDELQKNGKESTSGNTSSHNFGQDCMTCHNQKPSEAYSEGGWWNIAGSVTAEDGSGPFTNATMEFWSKPDREGVMYYSLPVDGLGNFYTAKVVNLNGSCFPVIVNNETGDYESMNQAYRSGGCNSCHGVTEDMIYSD